MTERRSVMLLTAAALAVYLLMNGLMLWDVLNYFDDRGTLRSSVYLAWIACGFVVFFALIVSARPIVLWVVLPFVLVSLATNYTYVILAKTMLTVDLVEWLPHEARRLPDAWREHGIAIAAAVAAALTMLAAFLLIRAAIRRRPPFRGSRVSGGAAGLAATAAFAGYTGMGMYLQPPISMAETNVYVFGVPALFAPIPDPAPVEVRPTRAPAAEKVVLVVDESVSHTMYVKVVLDALRRFPAVDFGEAASTANCSASSNALLRWGLQMQRVGEAAYDPRTNPTIWGYAKQAGFHTVLVDGQSEGAMHNYIHTKEALLIDEFLPMDAGLETDYRIVEHLNQRLGRPGREFIYVVKRGTHFPYEASYPKGAVPSTSSRVEKYEAAVRYSTRAYFERMARDLPFANIVMVYTSDHGQDLASGSTHCNSNPSADEYSVPLAVITRSAEVRGLIGDAARMQNRASHNNIFPTLLYAFGYDREWAERTYGRSLGGPPEPYLTYVHLSWSAAADPKKRRTVDTNAFTETRGFPRRGNAPTDR